MSAPINKIVADLEEELRENITNESFNSGFNFAIQVAIEIVKKNSVKFSRTATLDHNEAWSLAHTWKDSSNLAQCYIDLQNRYDCHTLGDELFSIISVDEENQVEVQKHLTRLQELHEIHHARGNAPQVALIKKAYDFLQDKE